MEIFQYNTPNEINGYSINDQYWVPANTATCDTTCVNCSTSDQTGCSHCYTNEVCKNGQLRNKLYQNSASNAHLIDGKNLYVIQLIHSCNMVVGCAGLLYLAYVYQ